MMKHLIKLFFVCFVSCNASFGANYTECPLAENVEASRHLIAEPNKHLETQVSAKIVEYRRDVYVTPSGRPAHKYDMIRLRIIYPYSLQTKEFNLAAAPKDRKMLERVGGLIGFSIKTSVLRDVMGGKIRWVLWIRLKDLKVLD